MTIIQTLRERLISDPSDSTLVQLRMELTDASEWLKTLAPLPVEVRRVAISPTLINEEEEVKLCQ